MTTVPLHSKGYVESVQGGIAEVHATRGYVLVSVIDEWGKEAMVALHPHGAIRFAQKVEDAAAESTADVWPEDS